MTQQTHSCRDCGREFDGYILREYCDECRKIRKREVRRRCQAKRRISRMNEPNQRGVEVIYVDGGMDKYGKRTFLEWLREGAFRPGDQYIMDGQRCVVG